MILLPSWFEFDVNVEDVDISFQFFPSIDFCQLYDFVPVPSISGEVSVTFNFPPMLLSPEILKTASPSSLWINEKV